MSEDRGGSAQSPRPSWVIGVLRTPLLTKLVFLDLVINLVAFMVMQSTPQVYAQEVTIVSLGFVALVNAGLVAWALRPLQVLEDTARRVSAGEYGARTSMPRFADRNLVRIGATLDLLLDRLVHERARVRTLAAQVVAAGDSERAHIARELHDGTAQSLTALEMLSSSLLADAPDGALREKVRVMRTIAADALAEVRALSHSLHPRVLDDLGLVAALEHLARINREQSARRLVVNLDCERDAEPPKAIASVFYRVAQEALNNVAKHSHASNVEVRFERGDRRWSLVVRDDGVGFDREASDASRRGMGLFVMQERVALVDGTIAIETARGRGTTVRVTVEET